MLNAKKDPYLEIWELDLTSRKMKDQYQHLVDQAYQEQIEREVTSYIQDNFYFCLIEVNDKDNRLQLESRIISTVSLCKDCGPSTSWLGFHSPKDKNRESGLWLAATSLYEATRRAWKLSKSKAKESEYVLATLNGLIVGAFVANEWLVATAAYFPGHDDIPGRIGFIGQEAPEEIIRLYVNKRVPNKYRRRGAANPVRYTW